MAYTAAANVRELLQGVTVAAMDDTRMGTFITRAENIINAKIGGIYAVPFVVVPPLIKTLAEEITAFLVMRTLFTDDSVNKNEWILLFKESMKLLEEIASGKVTLVDAAGTPIAEQTGALSSNNSGYAPVFDMDDILNSEVDADLIDAISESKE